MTVDLYEIAELLEQSHVYGRYVHSLCPFHSDRNASFFVYEDSYRCASCGAFGKTENLLAKLSHQPLPVSKSTSYFHNPWTEWTKVDTMFRALQIAHKYILGHPSEYLQRRGISYKYQCLAGLGYREGFYTFPIKDKDGKIVGGIARKEEGFDKTNKYILPAHQDPNLLYVPSWKKVIKSEYVFLTFGIVDALSLAILGHGAMSTTTGKRINPAALDWCRKPIYIIPDKNEIVDGLMLSKNLGWRSHVVKIDWPEDAKDCNDLFVKYPEFLNEVLSKCH